MNSLKRKVKILISLIVLFFVPSSGIFTTKGLSACLKSDAILSFVIKKNTKGSYKGVITLSPESSVYLAWTPNGKAPDKVYIYYTIEEWSQGKRKFIVVDNFGDDSSPGISLIPNKESYNFDISYNFKKHGKYRLKFLYYDSSEALHLINKRGPLSEIETQQLEKLQKTAFSQIFST